MIFAILRVAWKVASVFGIGIFDVLGLLVDAVRAILSVGSGKSRKANGA